MAEVIHHHTWEYVEKQNSELVKPLNWAKGMKCHAKLKKYQKLRSPEAIICGVTSTSSSPTTCSGPTPGLAVRSAAEGHLLLLQGSMRTREVPTVAHQSPLPGTPPYDGGKALSTRMTREVPTVAH
ncbi:unnamed protein product [Gadus morhua 'NCC']